LARGRDDAVLVHYDLARALTDLGDADGAVKHYRAAIKVAEDGDAFREFAEAHNNLGRVFWKYKRDLTLAEKHCRKAVELKPDYAEAHNNLAVVLIQLGQYDEAVEHLNTALEDLTEQQKKLAALGEANQADELKQAISQLAEVHNNYGLVYARQGRHEDAISEYEQAKSFDPANAPYYYNHGLSLEKLGRAAEAVAQYNEAMRIEPGWPLAARRAAWILATSRSDENRDGDYAVVLARGACKATAFSDPIGLDTLAAAYAEQGRFEEAVSTAQNALSLAASANLSELLPEIRARLDLYQKQQPYRADPPAEN
jgi:tetratricopeptide (TPR) repeat protein